MDFIEFVKMSNSGGGAAPPNESQGVVNLLAAELKAKSPYHELSLVHMSDELGKASLPLIKKALEDGDYQEAYVQYAVARSFGVRFPQSARNMIKDKLFNRIMSGYMRIPGKPQTIYPMKFYIEMGFSPYFENPSFRRNVIDYAIENNRSDWVEYLVEEVGIDLNVPDGRGDTPAKFAVKMGQLDFFRYLRDHGADINLGYRHGRTPFLLAAAELNFNIVKELYEEFGVNSTDNHGNTALHYASRSPVTMNYENIVRLLVDHGADINKQNDQKQTPFWLAVHHKNDEEAAKLLIDLGADTTIPGLSYDGTYTTPKQEAFRRYNYLLRDLLS